ncbi:hypothetical protein AI2943V1_2916, partial [Klebsiella oxytoca]
VIWMLTSESKTLRLSAQEIIMHNKALHLLLSGNYCLIMMLFSRTEMNVLMMRGF